MIRHLLLTQSGLKPTEKHLSRLNELRCFITSSTILRASKNSNQASPKSDDSDGNDRQQEDPSKNDSELVRKRSPSENIPEEEFVLSKFQRTELVPEVPLTSLDIANRINRLEKKGSFSADIFTGNYDEEFLVYPDALRERKQLKKLKEQAIMVKQLWPQIWDDNLSLHKYNFFNLHQLSISEMMTIFEAIGQSSRKCHDTSVPRVAPQTPLEVVQQQTVVTKAVISLISRACLTSWPIFKSDCDYAKRLIPRNNILFGGSATASDETVLPPIGFCWTEKAENLGSLPPQEWQTFGQDGGPNVNHHLVRGRKTQVLFDEKVEHYLVYFRDQFLAQRYNEDTPSDEPNPASDPFVGCCLVHKSEIRQSPTYVDSAGFRYTDIELDCVVPNERLVFPAKRKDPHSVNIKGLGQTATCAVALGILKDTLRVVYKYMLGEKRGILDCDIIERKLTTVTCKIFALESMVYYIAGMYDGLETGFDAHMETAILKIVTNEYAYEILQELQQICGSEMFMLSKLQDQMNILDAFLDGNIYNRLYLSTMGIIWFARSRNMHLNQLRLSPWYPGYFLKHMFKETAEKGNYLTLDADIYGMLHPSLKDAGMNLEYILKRVKYATETLCMRHGKDVVAAQSSLYRLSQLSIDAFMLTTLCARASKSYCNGSRNCEIDIAIATTFSNDLAKRVRYYVEELQTSPHSTMDAKAKLCNELNIKMGGYYAESPLDTNI